jgi:hypothetical protein
MIVGSPAKWQEVLARRGSDRQGREVESVTLEEKLWRVLHGSRKDPRPFGGVLAERFARAGRGEE